MFKLIAIILISTAQIGAKSNNPRIIGGFPAEEGKFPFAASILLDSHYRVYPVAPSISESTTQESSTAQSSTEEYTYTDHLCGAAILDERHLLTSAFCISRIFMLAIQAYVGSVYLKGNGTYYNISNFAVHPFFSTSTLANDIGVITLADPIVFDNNVQPINLPSNITVSPGDSATVIGWGTLSYPEEDYSNQMQELSSTVVDNEECAEALNSDINSRQICFGGDKGQGLCTRDFGSPLIHQTNSTDYVVGVFSYGNWCANGYPDVYTRVSDYVTWIRSQLT